MQHLRELRAVYCQGESLKDWLSRMEWRSLDLLLLGQRLGIMVLGSRFAHSIKGNVGYAPSGGVLMCSTLIKSTDRPLDDIPEQGTASLHTASETMHA